MALKKYSIYGIIGTILYLIGVVALLLLLGFTTPLPLPKEEAILIDFGGGGNIDAGASSPTTSNEQNASTQNSSNSGVNTQDFEDAASMQSSTTPNNNTNNTANTQTNPNADRLNNLFGGGIFGNGTGSGNSGTGTGSGNPGNGTGGDGSGAGPGGVGGGIGNRGLVKKVDPVGKDNMFGKVVLKITVNEQGNVTDITLVSTTCNECVQPAKDAVKQWKYESKPGAGYQTGQIVIEFKQN
jgi:TonB family protein